jgi:hypothetical protein
VQRVARRNGQVAHRRRALVLEERPERGTPPFVVFQMPPAAAAT